MPPSGPSAALVGVQKKKLTSSVMAKHLHCGRPVFNTPTRTAWEAYLKVAENDSDVMCILCDRVLTPDDADWIEELEKSGRALNLGIRRTICNCIRRCHLKCLLDKSSHVWAPRDSERDKDGVTTVGDLRLKCTRESPGCGIMASPQAAVLQCVCPAGHSGAVVMPILSHDSSFGTTIDNTEAVFEAVEK